MEMDCPLCDAVLRRRVDAVYFICTKCGAYVKDRKLYLSPEMEKARYDEHNNDVHDEGYRIFTAPIFNTVLEHYKPQHLGLDYGCGSGPIIAKQLKDRNYRVVLYDPYFYPDEGYLENRYDYIFSCEVFEHFHRPKTELRKLLRLLKPNGRLLIMTHIFQFDVPFDNWYYRRDPTHVFIYTGQTIKYIQAAFGLTLERMDDRLIVFKK